MTDVEATAEIDTDAEDTQTRDQDRVRVPATGIEESIVEAEVLTKTIVVEKTAIGMLEKAGMVEIEKEEDNDLLVTDIQHKSMIIIDKTQQSQVLWLFWLLNDWAGSLDFGACVYLGSWLFFLSELFL